MRPDWLSGAVGSFPTGQLAKKRVLKKTEGGREGERQLKKQRSSGDVFTKAEEGAEDASQRERKKKKNSWSSEVAHIEVVTAALRFSQIEFSCVL